MKYYANVIVPINNVKFASDFSKRYPNSISMDGDKNTFILHVRFTSYFKFLIKPYKKLLKKFYKFGNKLYNESYPEYIWW